MQDFPDGAPTSEGSAPIYYFDLFSPTEEVHVPSAPWMRQYYFSLHSSTLHESEVSTSLMAFKMSLNRTEIACINEIKNQISFQAILMTQAKPSKEQLC